MFAIELKSLLVSKRSETVKALENVNSPNPSDYRYLQGHIHCIDYILGVINKAMKDEEDA